MNPVSVLIGDHSASVRVATENKRRITQMADTSKSYYLDLDQKLYALRTHYAMCQDLKNEEVLEWAKFFLAWSREAVKKCGDWSLENLKHTENFIKNLEKAKVGIMGSEVLDRVMGEASLNLNREILKNLRQDDRKKQPLSA